MESVIIDGILKLDESNHRPYIEIDVEEAGIRLLLFQTNNNGKDPDKFVLKIKKHRYFIMKLFGIRIGLEDEN